MAKPFPIRLDLFLACLCLTACGGGSVQINTDDNSINPAPHPTLTLLINKNLVEVGDTIELSWSSQHVDQCLAGGAWSGEKPLRGSESFTGSVEGERLFALSCSGATGEISRQVSLTIVDSTPAPPTRVNSDDASALFHHFNQYLSD